MTMRMRRFCCCFSIACAAACGGAPGGSAPSDDAERVGARAEPIVGGSVTCNYPEIGLLKVGTVPVCTASLVAPDMILTAGHCVGSAAEESGNGTVYAFHVNDYDGACGTASSYPVKRFFSFGPRWMQSIDVAIAQLAVPVPTAVATPMNFRAGTFPPFGALTQMFGHGARVGGDVCVNSPLLGDFKKAMDYVTIDGTISGNERVFPFAHADGSNCQLDSGGPVFDGPGRDIFWVVSGGDESLSLFGEVWQLAGPIEQKMMDWSCAYGVWWDDSPVSKDERYPWARVCGADDQNYECDPNLRNWRALGGECGDTSCRCEGGVAFGGVAVAPERTTCGSTMCAQNGHPYVCTPGGWQLESGDFCGD